MPYLKTSRNIWFVCLACCPTCRPVQIKQTKPQDLHDLLTICKLFNPSSSLQFLFFSLWASSITTTLQGTLLNNMLSAIQNKKSYSPLAKSCYLLHGSGLPTYQNFVGCYQDIKLVRSNHRFTLNKRTQKLNTSLPHNHCLNIMKSGRIE